MQILMFLIISYILLSVSLYLVFQKAGEAGWKGLVPGLNFMVWCKLIGRKTTHAIWLLVPIVNLFIFVGMAIDLVRSFGKYQLWHSAVAFIYAPLAFFDLGLSKNEKFLGPTLSAERAYRLQLHEAFEKNDQRTFKKLEAANPYKKSASREWIEAIVFAVFAAAFIRMFLIEAYTIPTSSMEGSLNVGDFLFVSKAHYGIRTPKTVLMVPLLHNRIPKLNRESYIAKPDIPFKRLPALETIDRNDPVVFNYPEGDSVYVFPERTFSVYDYRRGAITPMRGMQIKTGQAELMVRPLDKKDHYIKRCVAIPGDTIQVKDRQLYINGAPALNPKNLQFTYTVTFPSSINTKDFSDWGISQEDIRAQGTNYMILVLSEDQINKLKALDPAVTVSPFDMSAIDRDPNHLFPHDPMHFQSWSVDNYGPVWVPRKGATITLTPESIALYRRVISVYEGNKLEEKEGKFIINGQETTQYSFKMDYYWMMGDNRHNSEDSRVWGFVPADHIVGKPLFIWFSLKEGSLKKGINWNRIFTTASKM
jgi:signal peptidase I